MERVKFDPSEFTGEYVESRGSKSPVFHTPITPKENYKAMFRGENPLWMPLTTDCKGLDPRLDPDNIARGFVYDEGAPFDRAKYGGPDMFGVPWVFVPVVGGSMVQPGKPLMEDANDWPSLIKFPDVDSWDWEGGVRDNAKWFETNKDYIKGITFLNGTGFERLISFMDFEGAAMACIDEDQVDAVKDLCDAIYERVYVPYIDNVHKYFPEMDKITLHDDWGSQRAPFFSVNVAREIFVPIYKKFTDRVKSYGMIVELHSCGKNDLVVPAYIESGFQTWNGMYMNDKKTLFEQYGDQFIFAVDPPDISSDMNASREDLEAAAKEFCEFYIRDGECHVVGNCMRRNPIFIEALYRISREMLNS